MRNFLHVLLVVTTLLVVRPVTRAGTVEIKTRHTRESMEFEGKRLPFLRLEPEQMLVLSVSGPVNMGLRLCEVMEAGEVPLPIDLTVVRDDQEQGTVRIKIPFVIAGKEAGCSEMVLVKVEIPTGKHTYRVLASGTRSGVMLHAFLGLRDEGKVIEATPGLLKEVPVAEMVPHPKKQPGRDVAQENRLRTAKLKPPSMDILDPVDTAGVSPDGPVSYTLIHHRPAGLGPGTRISASLAGMFLLGTTSLLISGSVLHDRSRDEPVQIEAGRIFDQADRAYQASIVAGSLTGAALIATLVCYLVEQPDDFAGPAQAGMGLTFRF